MDDSAEPVALLRELFARQALGVLATHGPDHPVRQPRRRARLRRSPPPLLQHHAGDAQVRLPERSIRRPRCSCDTALGRGRSSTFDEADRRHGGGDTRASSRATERAEQLVGVPASGDPHLRPFASALRRAALVELCRRDLRNIVRRFQNVTELHLG